MPFQVTEVEKHLKGVDYPTTREEELASQAERNGADPELVEALRNLGRDSFKRTQRRHEGAKGSLTGSGDR